MYNNFIAGLVENKVGTPIILESNQWIESDMVRDLIQKGATVPQYSTDSYSEYLNCLLQDPDIVKELIKSFPYIVTKELLVDSIKAAETYNYEYNQMRISVSIIKVALYEKRVKEKIIYIKEMVNNFNLENISEDKENLIKALEEITKGNEDE